jgi:hypothetical protein
MQKKSCVPYDLKEIKEGSFGSVWFQSSTHHSRFIISAVVD